MIINTQKLILVFFTYQKTASGNVGKAPCKASIARQFGAGEQPVASYISKAAKGPLSLAHQQCLIRHSLKWPILVGTKIIQFVPQSLPLKKAILLSVNYAAVLEK